MTALLHLQKIEVRMGTFRLALDLDVELGSLGIFGPSGSGKTTLLETIAGLRRPQAGRISLDGRVFMDTDAKTWLPAFRRHIGYVPQDLALFPHLNVSQNIRYGIRRGALQPDRHAPSLEALLEILELTPLLRRRPHSLSGGERQRVALARALAAGPRVLLLDEPLTGLDQDHRDAVLDYLKALRKKWPVPVIYVSHQADEIALLCDEMVVLQRGEIQARGRPRDLFETSARPAFRLRRVLGTAAEERHPTGE
jgi:molybdate transport system ATP-binding protein